MEKQKEYLKGLARELNDITSDNKWDEKRVLWIKKNSLIKTRPLILTMLSLAAWEELIPHSTLKCEDEFLREYEWEILRRIYQAKYLQDDEVLTNVFYVPVDYKFTDWIEGRIRPYSIDGRHAAAFVPSLREYSDYKKLRKPELVYIDHDKTNERCALLDDAFGGVLNIEKGQPLRADTDIEIKGWGYSIIDVFAELRGLEDMYTDLILAPDWVHEVMDFLTEGIMGYKETIRKNKLLKLNNNGLVYNCNAATGSNALSWTDELPSFGFDPDDIAYKDLWGYSMAQEFSEVSPDMLEEFVIPYQMRAVNDFGLLSYGCCESLNRKFDVVMKSFPNLRSVSIAYCTDLDIAAEKLGDRYVFSWKPLSTIMATFSEKEVTRVMSEAFEKTKKCHTAVALRNTLTLYGKHENAATWTNIVMDLAKSF